jgi:hypothetical protein
MLILLSGFGLPENETACGANREQLGIGMVSTQKWRRTRSWTFEQSSLTWSVSQTEIEFPHL